MMTKEDIKSNLEESKIEKSKETVKEPVKEVAEETVEESVKEPVKEVAEETVKESVKEPVEEVAEETVEETAGESKEETPEETAEESKEETPEETAEESTEETPEEKVEETEPKESISDLKMKIKEELKEELKSELKEDTASAEVPNEEEDEEEELDTKSLFLLNYQTRESMIAAIVIAVLAFLNSFVSHLFDGADDTVIIPIFATISSLVCFGTVGTYFYMATQYDLEKFKSSIVKLTIASAAVLIFTAIIQLLVVIFF